MHHKTIFWTMCYWYQNRQYSKVKVEKQRTYKAQKWVRIQYVIKMISNVTEETIKQFNKLSLELLANNLEQK